MSFKKALYLLDNKICSYLGLDSEQVLANNVEVISGKLIVTYTSSFKRHNIKLEWDDFNQWITKADLQSNNILRSVVARSIAKNLTITFEDPNLENHSNGNK